MIAASPEISRYGIVFAAAHVFNSLDDHHETKSSRQFLSTENNEGPEKTGRMRGGGDLQPKHLPAVGSCKGSRHQTQRNYQYVLHNITYNMLIIIINLEITLICITFKYKNFSETCRFNLLLPPVLIVYFLKII